MFKNILAVLTGLESDSAMLNCARYLGLPFNGHIMGLHVSPDVLGLSVVVESRGFGVSSAPTELWATMKAEADARAATAKKSFTAFCKTYDMALTETPRAGVVMTGHWKSVEGGRIPLTITHGRLCDAVIISRSQQDFGFQPGDIGDIVLRAGRPVFMTPEQDVSSLGTSIAIAWKDTPEMARALTAAMPLLVRADKVMIMHALESDVEAALESAQRAADSLRWHGIAAEVHCLTPNNESPATTVLHAVRESHADLLVMGAYGHSRLREFVFGGFTRIVLNKAALPVMMLR